jgi:hypothetical protein
MSNEEYKYRFDKEKNHKSFDVLNEVLEDALIGGQLTIAPVTKHTPFVECMPECCKLDNPMNSYRNYYKIEKSHIAKWTKRGEPKWWKIV